jgi:hypothetical protein
MTEAILFGSIILFKRQINPRKKRSTCILLPVSVRLKHSLKDINKRSMGRPKEIKAATLPLRSEHDEQVSLFKMIALHSIKYPALKFAFAVPNGARTSYGAAVKLKLEGLKSGVPDIFIPIPKNIKSKTPLILGGTHEVYGHIVIHGLFIEMKKKGNKPSPNQIEYMAYLKSAYFQCNVCYNADEAMQVILDYLK